MSYGGVVKQINPADIVRGHNRRISHLENSDGSDPWIPVGSSDPYFPTGYSPPYENGWSGTVEFKRFLNWLHIRGDFEGGADGTVVFTLPELYRPDVVTHMLLPLSDGAGFGSVVIATNGEVTYLGAFIGAPGTGAIVEITNTDGFIAVTNATGPIVDLEFDASGLAGLVVTSIDGGGGELTGDVTLSAGASITLNQVGNDIEINATGGGGVDSLDGGGGPLTGDVTLSAGPGISLAQVGQDIEIDNDGVISLTVGTEILTGDVTLLAGSGVTLTVLGGDTVEIASTGGGGSGIEFVTEPQLGDWLDVETSAVDADGFGMSFKNAKGMRISEPDPDVYALILKSTQTGGDGALGESIDIDTVDGLAFGFLLDATASGDGDSLAMDVTARTQGVGQASGMTLLAVADDAGNATGLSVSGAALGVGLTGTATGADFTGQSQDGPALGAAASANALGSGDGRALLLNTSTNDGAASGIDATIIASGNGPVTGINIVGQALAGGAAAGIIVDIESTDTIADGLLVTAVGDGFTQGANVFADSTGTGNVVGLTVKCGAGAGGTITTVLILDDGGNPIFEIRNDGTVHILTGTAILADL